MTQEQTTPGKKRVVIIIGMIALVAIGLTVASKLVREKSAAVPPTPAGKASEPVTAPVTPATPPTPADTASTTAFSGTSWKYDDISITLDPGGVLKASSAKLPFPFKGNWAIKDNVMTLVAMGKTITLQVDGDKLSKSGKVLERVQK